MSIISKERLDGKRKARVTTEDVLRARCKRLQADNDELKRVMNDLLSMIKIAALKRTDEERNAADISRLLPSLERARAILGIK